MKAVKARLSRGLNVGSYIPTCDNSGARVVRIHAVKQMKTSRGKQPCASIGDLAFGSVKEGSPEMRKTVVLVVIVRQRSPYKRLDGTTIQFEDNACVVLKDDKGNPKGTLIRGAIAKEAAERWPAVSKLARMTI